MLDSLMTRFANDINGELRLSAHSGERHSPTSMLPRVEIPAHRCGLSRTPTGGCRGPEAVAALHVLRSHGQQRRRFRRRRRPRVQSFNWWSPSGPLAPVFGGEGEGEGAKRSKDIGFGERNSMESVGVTPVGPAPRRSPPHPHPPKTGGRGDKKRRESGCGGMTAVGANRSSRSRIIISMTTIS